MRSYLTGSFRRGQFHARARRRADHHHVSASIALDRELYVGTCAVYFFILNTAKLPAYYASGQFAHAQISFTLRFLPLVVVGAIFGRWLIRRMSDAVFTKIVYIVTFALGWYILADGILRLFGRHIA